MYIFVFQKLHYFRFFYLKCISPVPASWYLKSHSLSLFKHNCSTVGTTFALWMGSLWRAGSFRSAVIWSTPNFLFGWDRYVGFSSWLHNDSKSSQNTYWDESDHLLRRRVDFSGVKGPFQEACGKLPLLCYLRHSRVSHLISDWQHQAMTRLSSIRTYPWNELEMVSRSQGWVWTEPELCTWGLLWRRHLAIDLSYPLPKCC